MNNWLKNIGPGVLISAAFIGPGTVTLCTLAGAQFGHQLLWAMIMSIIATIILQEMAARVGLISQKGLAEVVKEQIKSPLFLKIIIVLILSAIVIGNGAYEAGNITGASLGMEAVFGEEFSNVFPIIIGIVAFILLFVGDYKTLERSLMLLVVLMSLSFILAAILTKPPVETLLKGMFVPTIPNESILTLIGLIGTTVVPYNLFLHASLVKEKWNKESDLKFVRKDIFISLILGGLVSMAIIIAASAVSSGTVSNVLDLAKSLEPVYGKSAKYLLGVGLFAAGITSSITAPLAAAYVAKSCFGWTANLKDIRFRIAWMLILVIGVMSSYLKFSSIEIIKFAQITNGLLLPVIAIILLWIVNKSSILGNYKNNFVQNMLSIIIILIATMLGLKSILKVFEVI